MEWAVEPLCLRYAFCVIRKPIFPALAIKLRKIANTSTAIVRRKSTLTVTMQSVLSYTRELEEDFAVRFFYVRIKNILEGMMPSNIFSENSRLTHLRYITVSQMMIKYKGVLRLLLELAMDYPASTTLGISYLDDSGLFISFEDDILGMIEAADTFVKNDHKPALSTQNRFLHTSKVSLTSFKFAAWIKTKKIFQALRCFLKKCFSKQKSSPPQLCQCSSVLSAFSTTTKGATITNENLSLNARRKTLVENGASFQSIAELFLQLRFPRREFLERHSQKKKPAE